MWVSTMMTSSTGKKSSFDYTKKYCFTQNFHSFYKVCTMLSFNKNLNLLTKLFLTSLFVLLSACGGNDKKVYDKEVNDFKNSNTFSDLANCLGLESEIITKAFKPPEIATADIILIETSFSKNNGKFYSQWLYNHRLKISELVFVGKAGSDETVMEGNEFANLCGQSNGTFKISDSLLLKNDNRKNKNYGFALATFGYSEEAKKRTIKLSSDMNKLTIVNTRQVQTIQGN